MVFIIDWNGADNVSASDDLNLDGVNTLDNGFGDTVNVSISTPLVPAAYPGITPDSEWHLSTPVLDFGDPEGELITGNVSGGNYDPSTGGTIPPTTTTVQVATGMTGTTFELYDIDQDLLAANPWDDSVRVYALDAAGNPMPTTITITNTNVTHTVTNDGTYATIGATGAADPAVNGSGAADSVTVTFPGTIYGFVIEYSSGGGTYYSGVVGIGPVTFSDPTLMCFARGTMIETENGEVAVEELQAGDMIRTLDNGLKPLSWIGSTRVKAKGMKAPILFRKGVIGNTQDLLVSPAHRVMLQDWQAKLLFGSSELLASAQSLVNDSTIIRMPMEEVEYFHILFDSHEIVLSNGAPTESFHPGDSDVGALAPEARDEIYSLFPELEQDFGSYGPPARKSLRAHEAALLNL